jgi:hypothetical protein
MWVAGVELCIGSSVRLADVPDPSYPPFTLAQSPPAPSTSLIDVEVTTAPSPPNDVTPSFETGGAWDMRPEGNGYRLTFRRTDSERPHTVACVDAETTEVKIHI